MLLFPGSDDGDGGSVVVLEVVVVMEAKEDDAVVLEDLLDLATLFRKPRWSLFFYFLTEERVQ